jgi:hypothetical protein
MFNYYIQFLFQVINLCIKIVTALKSEQRHRRIFNIIHKNSLIYTRCKMIHAQKSEIQSKATGKNERTCNAAASAQTARVCRNFCAFEKIAEKRRWERHKIL